MLDVMPLNEDILGFSNRWYADALHTATEVQLPNGFILRAITAPYFLGTKMEAFRGRGHGISPVMILKTLSPSWMGARRCSRRCRHPSRNFAPILERQSQCCSPNRVFWTLCPVSYRPTQRIKPASASSPEI
jgi:hypothetical protein